MAEIKAVDKPTEANSPRQSGSMTAPYFDLDASVKVADAIQKNGGGTCTPDQLAHWLEYAGVRSGTYLTRISAANKHFGLIASEGDRLTVTERAHKILSPVMPDDALNAKVEAFLSAPLFASIFEDFRGRTLPPEVGLRNLFLSKYKMPADRVAPAVRIFLNSAQQAGILTADRSRLVRPPSSAPSQNALFQKSEESAQPQADKLKGGGGGDGGTGGVHTAIVGLLRDLPPPGTEWPATKKKRFLDAFKATIDFIYPDPEEGAQ